MIVFIALPVVEGKPWWEWIQRLCPQCGQASIVGHGRRSKQAHDAEQTHIRIRRGICRSCHLTFTFLPAWSLPYTHYSLRCRQSACQNYAVEGALEYAAPSVLDSTRIVDPSSVRRWLVRRVESWWLSVQLQVLFRIRLPTILAWDWARLRPILNHAGGQSHGPPVVGRA